MISIMEINHDNLYENNQDLPLYMQIKHTILESLESGVWKAGEIIPSEIELAAQYHVSQGTIRKAIDELVGQNILIRKQGSGTYVATHQEEQSKYRFLRLANSKGEIEDSINKILLCTHQKAPESVYKVFNKQADDLFVHIRRLMRFNAQPVVLEDIWLPCPLFEALTLDLLDTWHGSLYGFFESHFGIHMGYAKESLKAVLPSPVSVEFLHIDKTTPVLDIFRIAYTFADKPVEVRQAQYLTSEHHYFNRLN